LDKFLLNYYQENILLFKVGFLIFISKNLMDQDLYFNLHPSFSFFISFLLIIPFLKILF